MEIKDAYRLGYLVAILEGEGSFWAGPNNVGNPQFRVAIGMCDKEPLDNLLKWFGGTIGKPYQQQEDWTPRVTWAIQRRIEVLKICKLVYKFMSPRRQRQIDVVLKYATDHPVYVKKMPIHGTIHRYTTYKCRCVECKSAMSKYHKDWKAHKSIKIGPITQ